MALDLLLGPSKHALMASAGAERRESQEEEVLGGVVCVAAEVLPERRWMEASQESPSSAPDFAPGILLINGARDEAVAPADADASAELLRQEFGAGRVLLKMFPDRGGQMLRGSHEEETRCLMEFFSEHLHGVGRRGSQEAMERLGAEEVRDIQQLDDSELQAPPTSDIVLQDLD
eukprot:TRINITY_DN8552_c0_g1_i2.p2 TRINITY_DN8552_c0_g1~~TRINITY_DN8552_c0_g1_i2.p2  ORF type:complete len:175 (-),score=40.55 TRINITY_DN8552_c0_g1_i2:82-606(-)